MSLFKKKIKFPQFIANLMEFQFDFLEKNFDKFIDLDDKYKVMTAKDKEDLYGIIDFLVLGDLMIGCAIHLPTNKMSDKDMGLIITSIYFKFLGERRNLSKEEVIKKAEKYKKFIEYTENFRAEYDKGTEERKKLGGHPPELNYIEKARADLAVPFADYYVRRVATNQQKETWQGRNFAALGFAMATTKGDLVGQMLKEYSIDWS